MALTSRTSLSHRPPPRARPASARRGTTSGTKLSAAERTQMNLEHLSELRSPRFGLRTRYRTQEVAGSSPASSISTKALLRCGFRRPESYRRGESRAFSAKGTDRVAIYRRLLERADCTIAVPGDKLDAIFYDPLEQLMRQTLLGWQMVESGEFGATDWRHVSVIPEGNRALLDTNPSPDVPGGSLEETWRSVLREPDRYRTASPTHLLEHVPATGRWADWRRWLETRYGTALSRSLE
jgi:Restriction Endonuclease associating with ARP